MKRVSKVGLADLMVSGRKINNNFLKHIDQLIDWEVIRKEIHKYYEKGKSVSGRPSYDGLILFKMCLLQTWYGLSDYELEEQVNDRISFSQFVGISLEDTVPDHSVISRFRSELTKKRAYDNLLLLINDQLERANIIVKQGVIVDATIIDSPRKPKGKKVYEIVEGEGEGEGEEKVSGKVVHLQEKVQSGVDIEARWVKKGGRLRYGFKEHIGTDSEGFVLGVVTTAANESDTTHLEDVLNACQVKKGMWVKADKGYKSQKNDQLLKKRKLKNHIMFKAYRGSELSKRQKKFNQLVNQVRFKVERTFGSIKRWFKTGVARYIGLEKMHTQNVMEAIAYNLYRCYGISVSKYEK